MQSAGLVLTINVMNQSRTLIQRNKYGFSKEDIFFQLKYNDISCNIKIFSVLAHICCQEIFPISVLVYIHVPQHSDISIQRDYTGLFQQAGNTNCAPKPVSRNV